MPLDPQALQTSCALAYSSIANLHHHAGNAAERDACLVKAKALLDKAYATLLLL